ncbi:hypothetical protein AJ80_07057 [Polytolypa hystricis UAMH7299]|uniref:Uncharacterized protein n=1 Tax=Polytolypa hystricis (strain UAMH7299) TaxID=1447883 RepID=A0A2B7XSX7_POLH7|nr:hypothetical protein AJ80_07057 [Polytolypa hystricis UAMH7299]
MRQSEATALQSQEAIISAPEKIHIDDQLNQLDRSNGPESVNPLPKGATRDRTKPPFLNPFHADAEPPTELQKLIADLQPALNRRKQWDRLSPSHPFFQQARVLWKKHGWPEQSFLNFERLLSGSRNFPPVILMNPKNDHSPFDLMVAATPTLWWLERVLEPLGLTLDDIMVVELFPTLTDQYLDSLGSEKRNDVIKECFTRFSPERWGDFTDSLISDLSSSISGAKNQHNISWREQFKRSIWASDKVIVRGLHAHVVDKTLTRRLIVRLQDVMNVLNGMSGVTHWVIVHNIFESDHSAMFAPVYRLGL